MGKTILISSHILSELQQLCNKVGIIEKGAMIHSGPMSQTSLPGAQVPRGELRVSENAAEAVTALRADPRVAEANESDGLIRVTLKPEAGDLSAVAEILARGGFRLRHLRETGGGLEETYLRLTGDQAPT